MTDKRIQTYEEFWPYYLGEHSKSACRWLHFIGTSWGVVAIGAAILFSNALWILAGVIGGYAFAWIGHFFVEKNRPATFDYPWWSFVSDWKMWSLMVTFRIGAELERLGIEEERPEEQLAANAS